MRRHTSGPQSPVRRRGRRLAVPVLVVALSLALAAPALADRDKPVMPTRDEVRAAKEQVAARAADVGAIKAQLLMANQRLEAAATTAEQASEAYNGAMWKLEKAKAEVAAAQKRAARARRTVAEQRDAIGALVATSYQQGAELSALNAMMTADGPEGVLDQYAAFQGASTSLQADYERFAATDAIAQVFEKQAQEARAEQARVAHQAELSRDRAARAADAAQQAATSIAAEKERLIAALAQAQNISVDLARKRQTALEEIARQRAAEQARREAAAQARAEARAQAAAAAQAAAEAKAKADAAAAAAAAKAKAKAKADQPKSTRPGGSDPKPQPAPQPAPAPQPTPEPAPAPAPAPAPQPSVDGAQRAIAFAKAQLGEPYQWGATGPSSWDCSGLTMGAWREGGISLPHYSVAQYDAGTPISASELRPGDLVFWSSSSSPSGIHHVALYIGNGQIIHAPRTGRPVAIDDMYYWIPPTHFVRP
ncbi:NlpC/P60 family protein [Nocardioides mesophilus]|uniref:C40 family peptidase n=1 Tax=Nocardioides mesophilus TaxID=433659 RepID=A0A7G9R6H0_9ACTN|nr:C40 family peptidase [Nocardioides mesophilus]QNN51195.1 C40 family peptidase [Nocardioides mesophilus]